MSPTLQLTNMTAEEMNPDTLNPAHNPKFWCLPPMRNQPSEHKKSQYPMYPVSQGRAVGVWHNWTVVKAMDRHAREGSAWPWDFRKNYNVLIATNLRQQYCLPDLTLLSLQETAPEGEDRAVLGDDASSSVSLPSSPMTTSLSSASSITATTWADVQEIARYFAIWGGRIVYADRDQAKEAFLEAESEGTKPRILSTSDYDEAQAFSESIYWI
ncbi:hypothetical protein K438DRAFT_1779651 [Mycena galopus ATCC 62051]|nr:hypothetical protein K438DRAFT_1779651 [Mycena galopus ATCC 62051]